MSTAVKNQVRVCLLSVKYNIMREMVNPVTFVTNILFMMLNNATILVQWFILFRLRGEIGGYTMKDVMLLWGLTASSFGLSKVLFARVFSLPELIISGKLDSYLVQPKNVCLSVLTSATSTASIGDFLYGLVLMVFSGFSVGRLVLFLLFTVTGTVIFVAFTMLLGSLSFWFVRAEMAGGQMVSGMISFMTYPDGIFRGISRFLLYFLIPVGMAVWQPVHIMAAFNGAGEIWPGAGETGQGLQSGLTAILAVAGYAAALMTIAVFVFYRGLRRYSSSSLMEARM